MQWRRAEKKFVDAARVARLATVSRRGLPHNVPICPLLSGGKIYFGTDGDTTKVANLKANPRVALTFDDYSEDWERLKGVMVQGRARLVGPREFRALRAKLYAKYARYEELAPLDGADAVIVEVTPQRKFSWGLS